MTPAIAIAKKAKIACKTHEYDHDSSSESYGLEAAEKLNVPPSQVFKTLVVRVDDKELAVGVLPVSSMLSMKLIAKAVGAKKAKMADPGDVERSTGYVMGGVSPLGQKKRLKTVVDSSIRQQETVFISAGRRGMQIEIRPDDLIKLVGGVVADICQ